MAQRKSTIARDSVFRRIGGVEKEGQRPVQGIPPSNSPARQTAVWLADEEVAWLDTHIQHIKRSGWRTLTRSAFIRSLIRAAMEHSPDLNGVSGEEELTQRLTPRK